MRFKQKLSIFCHGVIIAIFQVLKKEFPKVKPFVDTSGVIIVAILSIVFLGYLAGVREGTIISAKNNPHMNALSLELWVSKER